MKTRTFITAITVAFFSISTMQAQEKKQDDNEHDHTEMKMDEPMYACLMHPDEKSDKAGECAKCGMEMENMEIANTYMCPMKCEGDKTYKREGDCPKCGMALKEMKKEDGHKEHKH